MRIAESVCGSSPSVFIRLKVSRQEMPASTRILVQALATTAQFPRLPLASIETHTPMTAAYAPTLWIGSNFLGQGIHLTQIDGFDRFVSCHSESIPSQLACGNSS